MVKTKSKSKSTKTTKVSRVRRTKKANRNAWFTPVRGSYLPNKWQGWLAYTAYVVYLIVAYAAAYNFHSSVSLGVLITLPIWFSATAFMQWFASTKSN